MITIAEINNRIIAKGNQLAKDTKDSICDINLHGQESPSPTSSKDVPSRPWMLTGGACIVSGLIGAMTCNEAKWPYVVCALGLASLGVGYTKRNSKNNNLKNSSSTLNIDEEKAFIVEKCNKILDRVKNEWDQFMDSIKSEVQNMIKNSSASDEKKDEYLSYTYYPETLSLSTLNLLDKFDKINLGPNITAKIISKKAEFANEIALEIINTANIQVRTYDNILI